MKFLLAGAAVLLLLAGFLFWMSRAVAPAEEPADQGAIRFGFILRVDGDTITFDEAKWLTGVEAQDAAIKAGLCSEETRAECTPNDFFIVNDATTTEAVRFATNPTIAMFTLSAESEGVRETQISKEELANLINDSEAHWSKLPYQMLIENGVITILEEVYVP